LHPAGLDSDRTMVLTDQGAVCCGLRVKVADRTDLPFAGLVEHSEVAEQLVAEMTKRPSQSSAWPAIAAPLPTIAAPPLAKSSAAIRLS
jgi:hypothetical protein